MVGQLSGFSLTGGGFGVLGSAVASPGKLALRKLVLAEGNWLRESYPQVFWGLDLEGVNVFGLEYEFSWV